MDSEVLGIKWQENGNRVYQGDGLYQKSCFGLAEFCSAIIAWFLCCRFTSHLSRFVDGRGVCRWKSWHNKSFAKYRLATQGQTMNKTTTYNMGNRLRAVVPLVFYHITLLAPSRHSLFTVEFRNETWWVGWSEESLMEDRIVCLH